MRVRRHAHTRELLADASCRESVAKTYRSQHALVDDPVKHSLFTATDLNFATSLDGSNGVHYEECHASSILPGILDLVRVKKHLLSRGLRALHLYVTSFGLSAADEINGHLCMHVLDGVTEIHEVRFCFFHRVVFESAP